MAQRQYKKNYKPGTSSIGTQRSNRKSFQMESQMKYMKGLIFISLFTVIFSARGGTARADAKITKLNEIVVSDKIDKTATTATKTGTPLSDIPATVTVVPSTLIRTQGSTASVDQTIRNVSGVSQSSSSNYGFFNNYVIRGLNMNFLRDGIPDGSTVNGYARSLVDVEKVEVLKGPGSALYGSGSPGGSVNLVTKTPESEPAYEFAQSFGSFDTYQTTVDLTGPVGRNDLLYRFIGGYYTTDGFRGLEKETTEVLPTITWQVSDGHKLTFDFDYRDIDLISDTNGIPFRGVSLTAPNVLLDVSRENKYYTPFSETNQEVFRFALNDEVELSDSLLLRNNFVVLDRELYLLRNAGGTVAAGSSTMTGRSLRQQTDDVTDYVYQFEPIWDFETGSVKHKLLTGFETQYHDLSAQRQAAALPNILNVFNPIIPETSKSALTFVPTFDRDIQAFYLSGYAQDQIELTEQWKARLGGRYDRFDTDVQSRLNNTEEDRQDDALSGQAGLVFQPIHETSFYGGVSSSKQAILSTESSSPLNVPESALQYEIGNRTSFLDDKLNINVAWFDVTRENFLVTIGTDTIPVGEQKTQGVDIDMDAELMPGWNLYANYSYQDAELVDVPVLTGPSVIGNRPTGIPADSASFWSTYELQEGPLKGFGFGGGLTYKGPIFINQTNTSEVPGYTTGDLVFFYHKDFWEAQLNITNVGDVTYFRNGVNSGALPGDPLAVTGTVRVKF